MQSTSGHSTHPTLVVDADFVKDQCDTSNPNGECPVLAAIGVIGTEWRLAIVHYLMHGPQRFSAILKSHKKLNAKTLSATLKFLENQGVVVRKVLSDRPFAVEYDLTDLGRQLAPAAQELATWGQAWIDFQNKKRAGGRDGRATRHPSAIEGELPRVVIEPAAVSRGR